MKTFQFFPKVSILPKSLNSSQKSQFFPTAVLKSSQQSQKEKEREISKIQSISQVQNAEEFYLLLYSIPLRTHLFSPPRYANFEARKYGRVSAIGFYLLLYLIALRTFLFSTVDMPTFEKSKSNTVLPQSLI